MAFQSRVYNSDRRIRRFRTGFSTADIQKFGFSNPGTWILLFYRAGVCTRGTMIKKPINPMKDFVAGGFGGICCVATGHPLDTIKVRLQTMPLPVAGQTPQYRGMLDCAIQTVRKESVFGLYKGMAAPIVGVAPVFAICFFGYRIGKRLQTTSPDDQLTYGQMFNAGMLAGVFTTSVMAPGERIKCLLQVQLSRGEAKFKGPIDCAKQLFREGGMRSVYRGTCGTLLRDVPGTGLYFVGYEFTKDFLTPAGASKNDLSPHRVLLAGGLAGMFMWLFALPADILKSRLQTAPDGRYSGVRDVFRQMMREESVLALYRGITPVMLRAFPANAATFLGYEIAMKGLNWLLPNV